MADQFNENQIKAIDSEGNVLVSAGAGSGKTKVLTQRICNNILKGVKLDEILVLTFTNDAAKEMKDRLKQVLMADEKTRDLVPLVDSANISTFDSYFLYLVKKYYYYLGVSSDVANIPDDVILIKKYMVLAEIFDKKYKNPDEKFIRLIHNYCVKNDNNLFKFIISISKVYSSKTNKEEFIKTYYEKYLSDDGLKKFKEDIIDKYIKNFSEEFLESCHQISATYEEKISNAYASFFANPTFENTYNNSILTDKKPKLPNKGTEDVSDALKNYSNGLIKKFKEKFNKINYSKNKDNIENVDLKNQRDLIPYILDIVVELEDEIEKFKYKLGYFTFSDIANLALKLIEEHEDVRNSIKNKLKLIMIDEFQDTSIPQEYFISLISNNNVFVVGDVKQSIYGFRDANPQQFMDRYENYKKNPEAGKVVEMNENYRSRQEINDQVNEIFSQIMDIDHGGADYEKSHLIKTGNKKYEELKEDHPYGIMSCEIETDDLMENGRLKVGEYKIREAEFVAEDILKRISNGVKVFVKNKDDKVELRPSTYKDFTILISKSTDFGVFEEVFSRYGIPLNSVKDDEIRTNYAVITLISMFTLINEINSSRNLGTIKHTLFSTLRSFLFEYSDEKLYKISKNNEYLNDENYLKIQKFAYDHKNSLLSEIFMDAIKEFGFIEKLYKLGNAIDNGKYVELFYNRTKIMDNLNYSLSDFILYLENLDDLGIEMNVRKNSEAKNVVTLTTIHKSKGLEYNVVYLPFIFFGNGGKNDYPAGYFVSENYGFYLPSLFIKDKERNQSIHYIFKEEIEKSNQYSEMMRVLYVALTRAKEEIIIPYGTYYKEKMENLYNFPGEKRIEMASSIGEIFFAATKFSEDANKFKTVYSDNLPNLKLNEGEDVFKTDEKVEISDYRYDFPLKNKVVRPSKELKEGVDLSTLHYGTHIHLLMECLKLETKNVDFIEDNREKDLIKKASELPIFDNVSKGKIFNEYEYIDEETGQNGIIDLLIVYSDYADIIDFKLKNIDDEAYGNQLNAYRDIVKRIFKKEKVNCYLLSIINSEVKEIKENE